MNQNTKKFFVLSIIALFSFAMIAPSVTAQVSGTSGGGGGSTTTSTPVSLIIDPMWDMFANWEKGKVSEKVAKYLVWILLTLLIYAAMSSFPMFKKRELKWVRWVIGVIAGFLAVAYITPGEIYAMMVSYSAMGFVLGGFLPILILLFFTWNLANDSNLNASNYVFTKIVVIGMWALFTIFGALKIFFPVVSNTGTWYNDLWPAGVFPLVGFFMTIYAGRLTDHLREQVKKEKKKRAKETMKDVADMRRQEAEMARALHDPYN